MIIPATSTFAPGVPTYAGIGSRKTPHYILDLMRQLGRSLCDAGYRLRSGGAIGADTAFYEGAIASPRFPVIGAEIYLPWDGFDPGDGNKLYADPVQGYIDATRLPNHWDAQNLALEARGGEHGLTRGGVALHARNAYQVLGEHLDQPAHSVVFWAEPVGQGKVKGGTNTAVQLALARGIRTINLFTPEGLEAAETFMRSQPRPTPPPGGGIAASFGAL